MIRIHVFTISIIAALFAHSNYAMDKTYPEIAQYLAPTSKLHNQCLSNNSSEYHCKKISEFLWCAKNAPSQASIDNATQKYKEHSQTYNDAQIVAAQNLCGVRENYWQRIADKVPGPFWDVSYYSSHICDAAYCTTAKSIQETAHLIHVMDQLHTKKTK